MNITVTARSGSAGILTAEHRSFACVLGRAGISAEKREGDGATPSGNFPLRELRYRADRMPPPVCGLPIRALTQTDGWCDAPSDDRYNCPVAYPYRASAETLWREDGVYDLILVIGYNDRPPVPGLGSAIFLHCATPDMTPTEGCIALSQDDVLILAALLEPQSFIAIRAR